MADSYGRHLLRTPRHLPARRSPVTQSSPLQRSRAERSRDPPAPRAPRAHGARLLDVRYTNQRAVNLHRFWPRNCSKPEHLPRAYVRIVGAMLTRQLAHWHTIINGNGRHDKLAVGSGRNHRGRLPQNENAVGTYIDELAHAQACQYAALDGWTRIARAMKISWAADGGTLLGAMCYRAMPAWDDDMDLVVPQEDAVNLIASGKKHVPCPASGDSERGSRAGRALASPYGEVSRGRRRPTATRNSRRGSRSLHQHKAIASMV